MLALNSWSHKEVRDEPLRCVDSWVVEVVKAVKHCTPKLEGDEGSLELSAMCRM